MTLTDYLKSLLKPEIFLKSLGPFALAGVFFVIFAESGLFFGFFLPGDSLLFTAGLLSSQGYLNFPLLAILSFIAAASGDNVGYWFGHKVGPKIFAREDSFLFKKHHLIEAQNFYQKHGSKTIVLARFVPFVRTFAPIVAGAANMNYQTFMTFNLIGALLWSVGIASLGYFLGNIPFVKTHYEAVIFLIIAASLLPVIIHLFQSRINKNSSIR